MDMKQTSGNADKSVNTEVRKLESLIKRNLVAVVIIQIFAIAIIAGAVIGLIKVGLYLFGIILFFAVILEVFAYSLIRENKGYKKRLEIERTRPVSSTVFADPLYKNKGFTYDIARGLYCSQTGKKENKLSKEDEAIIWQYSYDDFAYLLMWIIEKDLYQPSKELDEDDAIEAKAYVSRIKRREELPTDYLESYEGYFMEDSIKKKARAFVIEYYKKTYEDEVREFAKEALNAELYGFPFRWEDYDAFKVHIDEAYENYLEKHQKKPKDDVSSSKLTQKENGRTVIKQTDKSLEENEDVPE